MTNEIYNGEANKETKKSKPWYIKFAWFFLILVIFISFSILKLYLDEKSRTESPPPPEIKMERTEPVTIEGFDLYTDEKYNFEVLLPEKPKTTTANLGIFRLTNWRSVKYLSDTKFIQYSVSYIDTRIYSDDSINAFLDSYLKGKIKVSDSAKIIMNNETNFKNFPARDYSIEYMIDRTLIKNRGIVFVANGDPIDLSVTYPNTISDDLTMFDQFIKSFILK